MPHPRDAILAAAKVPHEDGEVLGQRVRFRGLTAGEQTDIIDGRPIRQLMIPILAAGLVGDDDKPLFSEKDLRGVRLAPFEIAFARIMKLTGATEEAAEETEKNS